MKSNAELMSQNNPEHSKGLDTIEYIKNVMFMLEDFECLCQIECVEEAHSQRRIISEFRDTIEVSRD